MNYYEHHIGDFLKKTAHLSAIEDGIYRRLLDRYYTIEAPLPADLRECCKLARANSKSERDAVKAMLGEFFSLEDDGYHQRRADEEIAKYLAKTPERDARRENDAERQRRARDRRKALFELLRGHNIVPSFSAKNHELEAMLSRVTSHGHHAPVTRDYTATSPQSPVPINTNTERAISTTSSREPPEDPPPEANGHQPTPAGAICRAIRNAGFQTGNPGDPRLAALIARGITETEFVAVATEAVQKSKPWAWLLKVVEGRHAEAAQISASPAPQAATPPSADAWVKTRSGVIDRACELGIGPWNESAAINGIGPDWRAYRSSVIAAHNRQIPETTQ